MPLGYQPKRIGYKIHDNEYTENKNKAEEKGKKQQFTIGHSKTSQG
ncbi:MAG: hypothetical protein MJE68_03085 [Proteobacteria bacterium]|nr:hypothetical protein [Pseudomonadota bacterium]